MKTWDTWEGKHETNPIIDHNPSKTEFIHVVIDELTKNSNDASTAFSMARAGVPPIANAEKQRTMPVYMKPCYVSVKIYTVIRLDPNIIGTATSKL